MPVSADIYSQIQQPKPVNMLANMAQAYELQNAAQQNRLGNMKMEEFERGNQRRNALSSLAGQYGDKPEMLETEMRRGGYLDEAAALGKSRRDNMKVDADVGKTGAETEKIKLATARDKLSLAAQLLSTARDQASYDAARATAQANGLDVSRMPPQFDPQFVQTKLQESQSVADQLEQMWKQKGYDLDVRKQGEVERNNQTQNKISQGNLNVAQGNLGLSKQRLDLEKQNATASKAPAGYRLNPDGSLAFIPGGPADPAAAKKAAPTEFQGKNALFGARAQEADKIITALGNDFSPMAINAKNSMGQTPLIGGALEAGANVALSGNSQKAEQAQRDFINAILRLESGAAIGKDEFDNARKQYFPQPGDGADVKRQKAENRKLAVQGLLGNAGNAVIPKAGSSLPNSIDSLLDKYK